MKRTENRVILFAGTTEGRLIAERCRGEDVDLFVCVATEYGESRIESADNIHVLSGRKDHAQIADLLRETGAALLIDATHPYAAVVTETLQSVTAELNIEYIRVLRSNDGTDMDNCIRVDDADAAAAYLSTVQGNILLTVGSKELSRFTAVRDYRTRITARILPMVETLENALSLGFDGSKLICMQGPFSEELNVAMLRAANARYLVTKDTGSAGGFPEKIRAALHCGVTPVVIQRPTCETGCSLDDCLQLLRGRFAFKAQPTPCVTLVGVGPGDAGMMTQEAERAISEADLIIGAKRLTDSLTRFGKPVENAIAAEAIASIAETHPGKKIVVALSGDTGFYSGAKSLRPRIGAALKSVIPGISSIAYFCARAGTSYDDACLISTHGRRVNFIAKIRANQKVITLTGGDTCAAEILRALGENGLDQVRVTVGENLSYENERIVRGTVEELSNETFDPLAVVMVENPAAADAPTTHGFSDEAFIRGDVPMTKMEVRALTLSKLALTKGSVCWDIGAGTGSVSIEMALRSEDGAVFAVEKNEEACRLIQENQRRFAVTNLRIIQGTAPDVLSDLPTPSHVFIGGSDGKLRRILEIALKRNPKARVVINTVTLETLAEAVETLKTLPVREVDFVQLNAARARSLGKFHLMTAQNPVFIISCTGSGNADD